MNGNEKPGCGRAVVAILVTGVVILAISLLEKGGRTAITTKPAAETYRLVHAIGNTEKVSAKGLSKDECDARKRELKAISEKIGTYNERTGYGSITCIAESIMRD